MVYRHIVCPHILCTYVYVHTYTLNMCIYLWIMPAECEKPASDLTYPTNTSFLTLHCNNVCMCGSYDPLMHGSSRCFQLYLKCVVVRGCCVVSCFGAFTRLLLWWAVPVTTQHFNTLNMCIAMFLCVCVTARVCACVCLQLVACSICYTNLLGFPKSISI